MFEEEEGNHFIELSLASVVRKTQDLELALRKCRNRAETKDERSSFLSKDHKFPSLLLDLTKDKYGTGRNVVTVSSSTDQWQQLTSYIVSLEKEVQYYKQLVQDIQTNQHNLTIDPNTSIYSTSEGLTRSCKLKTKTVPSSVMKEGSTQSALLCVFSYLSISDLCHASRVCHEWLAVARHPSLWKKVVLSEIMLRPKVLLSMAGWCSSTEALVLHGLMPPMASCNEDLHSYISKTRGSLEPAVKTFMEVNSESLQALSVTECNLMTTERVLWLASVHCPNLQSLSYCSDEFPPTANSLWSLANGCRQLRYLNLPPVLGSPHADCFNDSCLLVIGHAWPSLLSLTVGGSAISTKGLVEIAQRCRKLEYLELIHGPCLHKDAIEELCQDGGFSSLARLVLNFTPISHVALKHFTRTCPNIQSIELHVTLRSYFTEKPDEESTEKYAIIINNLKKLKRNLPYRNILHVYEH